MKQLIVRSHPSAASPFYNVIELDDVNNQEVLTTSEDLNELQSKYPDAPVIEETEIADHHHEVQE